MKDYLAVYDIADPKRLRRMAKIMQRYGVRVQKSVFECRLKAGDFARLCREAQASLDPDADGVRFYPLPFRSRERQTLLGDSPMVLFPTSFIV